MRRRALTALALMNSLAAPANASQMVQIVQTIPDRGQQFAIRASLIAMMSEQSCEQAVTDVFAVWQLNGMHDVRFEQWDEGGEFFDWAYEVGTTIHRTWEADPAGTCQQWIAEYGPNGSVRAGLIDLLPTE
jgi:hypothetical protein